MAINLSGGKGIPSFEEWKKQNRNRTEAGGTSASVLQSAAKAEKQKADNLFDLSSRRYADAQGVPLWNRTEIDNGSQRKAEQLKAAADRLNKAPALTDDEMRTLSQATALRRSGQRAEAAAFDLPIKTARRENAQKNEATADKLKEKAYYTEQAGIKTVGEKLAQSDPDFEAKAAAGYASRNNPIQKMRSRQLEEQPEDMTFGSTLSDQLKRADSGQNISVGVFNGMQGVNPSDMTSDELKTYSYWLEKSPNAAKRYLESISADVNKRTAERESRFYSEKTRELRNSGVLGTAAALGGQIMLDTYTAPLSMASALSSKLSGKPYDPNSAANRGTINASAMQEGLTGDLSNFGKFLADTGISTAQYLSRIPLGTAGLVVMASGAAGKTANEVKRNGGTTDQALTLGTVAGLAEYATEKIPFENIKAAFNGGEKKALAGALEKVMKSKLGSVVGSTLEEGMEELISEYINNIANDTVLGDSSDMKQYALELISQGMSYEDATKAAFKQYYVTNPFIAFAGGALSGGVMSGIGEGYNGARNAVINNAENRYFKANGQQLLDAYEKSNGIGNRLDLNADEQQLSDAAKDYTAPADVSIEVDSELMSDPEIIAAVAKLTTEEKRTPVSDSEAPQVSPKNQFANPTGKIVLDTAAQASRKQRANAAKTDVERSGILAGASDADIAIAKSLSKVFGRNIIFDSTDASVNGKFSDGTIYVNPNGSDNVITILAHELTHSAEGSAEYETLKRCIKQDLADRGKMWSTLKEEVRKKYAPRYESMGQTFTDADCESETLALAAQALFEDEASMQSFVKQNRSAASRLWYRISRAAERLKQDISYRFKRGEPDVEARKRQLAVRQLEDARDMLAKALRATRRSSDNNADRNSFAERKIPSYDELIAKPDMNIVDIGSEDKSRPFNEQNRDFKKSEEAKEICKEPVVNRDTGEKVFITPKSLMHIYSNVARYKSNVAKNIRTIIENAILTHSEKTTHGADNADGIYTLFAAVRTDEGVKPLKLKIKEYNYTTRLNTPQNIAKYFDENGVTDPYSSVYDGHVLELESVEEIKTEAVSSSVLRTTDESAYGKHPSTASTISIADFLPLVNSESKKYLPEKSDNSGYSSSEKKSVSDSQYGTKPINSLEETLRKKALVLFDKGYDPEDIYNKTGWFKDSFGTLTVNHDADIYLYGDNGSDTENNLRSENTELRRANEELTRQNAELSKPKSEQLGVDQLREAYNLGEREARRMINKALHTSPDMTPDKQYVKTLVDDLSGSYVSEKKKRDFRERLTDIYDRMGDADASGTMAMSDGEIADELNRLASDILDSREYTDNSRAELQKNLKAEFRTPMFVSATARGDFAEGWNNVRKSYFGKMRLTSDRAKGTPVDVRYMELSDAYPDWFPQGIENETEQLTQIFKVCDTISDKNFPVESYYSFSGWQEQYKKDHAELVGKLSVGYRDLKQQPRTWADKIIKDINDERSKMEKLHESEIKRLIEEAQRDADEQLTRYEQLMIDTQKQNSEREKSIRDYYEGREQSRLDREAKAKAEKEARRIRRGGEIDNEAVNAALGDNTFTAKMQKLYDYQKKLSTEYEKYADVDIDSIEDADTRKYVKRLAERLDDLNTYINRVGQVVRKLKRENALATIAKGDIMKWRDKQGGFVIANMYSRETMRRNIEDISKGDELGKEIIRNYIDPIQRDVARSTRFKNSLRERVRALGLELKPTGKNKLSESAFVQLLGEARDNIAMLESNSGASVTNQNGEPVREGKTLSDWRAIRDTLMLENPDMDMVKINKAISEFQNIYDELFSMINNVRVMNGYAPAEYHHGYFPHYNNDAGTDGILSNLMSGLGFNIEADGLPTSINGLTHTFRPGTKYMSNLKQRSIYGVGEQYNGFTLNSGAVEGFDRYIETAADVIFLTGDIQNLRALSDAIRYSTTDEGVKKQVDSIRDDGKLTPQEQDSLIAELYDGKQKFHLRNFVIDLEEYTNILAGKKSIKDRQWEQNFGRGMYQAVKKIEQFITANQIALNPGSWLTNFVPLTQAGSVLTQRQMLGAMLDTIKATIQDDGFASRSDFLTNRRGSESLVKSGADKFRNAMSKPMEIIDGFTSETIVRARYAQNLKKGMNETDALHEADIFTNKLMANRAKGDMPTAFYASNPVSKLFTMYQLEVNNQWSFMLKDLPKEAKGSLRKLAAMLFKLCIGSWLYNEIYEAVVGRRCAFDLIDMLNDFAGDLTGYKLPGVNKALDAVFNPEKRDDLFKAKKVGVTNAVVNLVKNVGGELPFFGGVLFEGGRIPISSALPDLGNIKNALDFSTEKAGSKRAEMIGKEIAKPLFYTLPPYGGGQLKKAVEGVSAFAQGGSYIRDNNGKKQLQYPIENQTAGQVAMNLPRAVLFGKTANKYGREWVDNGFGSYSAKATEAYQALVDDGISQADALDSVDSIKSESSRAGKVKALRNISGSSTAKRRVFEKMILSSDDAIESAAERLNSLDSAGISFDSYLRVYDTYLSVSGDRRKPDVISAIDGMKLSDSQKDVLYCCFYKEGGLPDTPWHSYGVKKAVLPELGLPEITMPEIKMPEIKMPEIKLPGLK